MILVSMRTQSAITLVNKPVQIIVIINQLHKNLRKLFIIV